MLQTELTNITVFWLFTAHVLLTLHSVVYLVLHQALAGCPRGHQVHCSIFANNKKEQKRKHY